MMVGREIAAVFPKREVALGDIALELRNVSQPRRRDCATFRFLCEAAKSWDWPAWSALAARSWRRRCSD